MQYIEAPSAEKAKYRSVFLAGGISHTRNWQKELAKKLEPYRITVFNPRRKAFDLSKKKNSEIQIAWEFKRLRQSEIIVFWFSAGTVHPIALFELGAALERKANLIIGVDPTYDRKLDVKMQTRLMNKKIKIHSSLSSVLKEIRKQL